jgi:hypothetical protein
MRSSSFTAGAGGVSRITGGTARRALVFETKTHASEHKTMTGSMTLETALAFTSDDPFKPQFNQIQ